MSVGEHFLAGVELHLQLCPLIINLLLPEVNTNIQKCLVYDAHLAVIAVTHINDYSSTLKHCTVYSIPLLDVLYCMILFLCELICNIPHSL